MKYRVPAVLRHSVRYFLQPEAEPELADRIKTPKVETEEPAAALLDSRRIMERKILREEPEHTAAVEEPDTQPEVKPVETEELTAAVVEATPLAEPATVAWERAENPAHRPETAPTQPAWALNLKELERVEVLTVVAVATEATVEPEILVPAVVAVATEATVETLVPTLHRITILPLVVAEEAMEATVETVVVAQMELSILREAEAAADMGRVETEETEAAHLRVPRAQLHTEESPQEAEARVVA